ncbi:MAG: hypothetical protein LBF04_00335 [Prevotellaceae bacterium]|jgi:hypothetical protein|nr:hypothetical protein [Prevotellaceae bacterium]
MKKLLFSLLFVITAIFISCDDIFDKKIERYTVEIIAPYNGATLKSGNIHFTWKALDGALKYQLVIVSPSFDRTLQVVVDTAVAVQDSAIVSTYNHSVNLSEGNYQWYVQAQNFSYSSKKQIYDLIIID